MKTPAHHLLRPPMILSWSWSSKLQPSSFKVKKSRCREQRVGENIVPIGSSAQDDEGRRGIEEGSHSHQWWMWQGMAVCMSWGLRILLTGTSGCDYDKQGTETVAI